MAPTTNAEKGKAGALTAKDLKEPAVDTLIDILQEIDFLQDYMNDQVVHDIAKSLSAVFKLLNAISATDLVDIIERGLQDPNLDKVLINPPRIGVFGLLGALKNEEVQKGVGIMVELLKAIGRASIS